MLAAVCSKLASPTLIEQVFRMLRRKAAVSEVMASEYPLLCYATSPSARRFVRRLFARAITVARSVAATGVPLGRTMGVAP